MMDNLWVIFLTGLTVGGLTCLAVQGGLLASVIAAREGEEVKKKINARDTIAPTIAFIAAKFVSYTVLGFLLGTFGSTIGINGTVQTIMQFLAGLYMIIIALNLLDVHPIFRYAVIQPPRFLTRRLRNQSKSKALFAPAILGMMTIFIPCGTTLAMEALAISSASAFSGALIMAVFILGTAPLFFGIGWLTSVLGDNFRGKFLKIAAVALIFLGFTSLKGAMIALNFPIQIPLGGSSLQKENTATNASKRYSEEKVTNDIEIMVTAQGYTPEYLKVKKGEPVHLKVVAKDAYSCASAFRIPSLGIRKDLSVNETYDVTFTPAEAGQIRFTCSMGMYSGVIEVL